MDAKNETQDLSGLSMSIAVGFPQQAMRQSLLYTNMAATERLNTCTEILSLCQVDPADVSLVPDLSLTSFGHVRQVFRYRCSARARLRERHPNYIRLALALSHLHKFYGSVLFCCRFCVNKHQHLLLLLCSSNCKGCYCCCCCCDDYFRGALGLGWHLATCPFIGSELGLAAPYQGVNALTAMSAQPQTVPFPLRTVAG